VAEFLMRRLMRHHRLGQHRDDREGCPEVVRHDGDQLVPRMHRSLLTDQPPLEMDFDGAPPQFFRGLEVGHRPRAGVQSHLLPPEPERMPGPQTFAGTCGDGFLWVAAPVHRLDDFRAEPQEARCRRAGKNEREQSTGDAAGRLGPKKQCAERRRREYAAPSAFLVEPRRDLLDERRRRCAAASRRFSRADHGGPFSVHEAQQFVRVREQARKDVFGRGAAAHRFGESLLGAPARGALRERLAVLECGDVQRGQAAEKLARRARVMRNAPRAGVIEAADEPPQAIANDERDAHGSADAHVRHVLEVNGRDAA
jgi:hypothetical protein